MAELNAGTALQSTLVPTGLEGFENTTAEVDNTSLASTFDTKLPGRQSFSGTGLVLKKQTIGSDTVYDLLTVPNTNGYIVIRDGIAETTAWAAAQKAEVHPIRTAAHTMVGRGEANSVLRYRVPTPITSAPSLKATVAA